MSRKKKLRGARPGYQQTKKETARIPARLPSRVEDTAEDGLNKKNKRMRGLQGKKLYAKF